MKRLLTWVLAAGWAGAGLAAPLRVALLDFEDQTGMAPDARLGGAIAPGALAGKGAFLLSRRLSGHPAFSVVDRRDFVNQIERQPLTDAGMPTPVKPSFLHAAQALRTDAVLRGSILSLSTGKQVVNQGGFQAEFTTLTVRVALEALDVVDGTVIAVSDAAAHFRTRQTPELQTVLGEDEVLDLMDQAVGEALPALVGDLESWQSQRAERPTIRLTVTTSADPALVEIDGILVGTTPLENHELYRGDHVLRVGKPGFYDVTKRIQFDRDTAIEVPMLRVELTADELVEVLKNIRFHVFKGEPGLIIHEIRDDLR